MTKKPFKVMSGTAITAAITATSMIPAAVSADSENEDISLDQVIVQNEGNIYEASITDYLDAKTYGSNMGEVKYVVSSNGNQYDLDDYLDAKGYTDGDIDEAFSTLSEDSSKIKDVNPGTATIEDGEVVFDEVTSSVESISAINANQELTVTFDDDVSAEDLEDSSLTLTNEDSDEVTANFKKDSLNDNQAVFTVDAEDLAEGTYTVTSDSLNIDADTEVVYEASVPEVEETQFMDYQTISLSLNKEVTGEPEVTVNGNDVDAKLSENGQSISIVNKGGYDAGEYTINVSGLEDAAGNTLEAEETVTKEASKAEEVTFTSKAINVDADADNDNVKPINFDVVDQYGEDMEPGDGDLQLDAKYGQYPVTTEKIGNTGNEFELDYDAALKDGRDIGLTVYKTVDDEFVEVGSKTLTVSSEEPELADISEVGYAADQDTDDLKAGDTVTLAANVVDQFNNDYDLDKDLLWTTDDKDVAGFDNSEDGSEEANIEANRADGETTELTLRKEGTATITAFSPDGSVQKSFEVNVGQGQLDSIVAEDDIDVTNKSSLDEANIGVNSDDGASIDFENANDNNIGVKADDISFDVEAPKGFDAEDVSVEKQTDDNGNLTGLKVTTDRSDQTDAEKAGNYDNGVNYTVTVKSASEDVDNQNFTVTSKIDGTVDTIKTEDSAEFRQGTESDQAVTFLNENKEEINVKANDVSVNNSGVGYDLLATNDDDKYTEVEDNSDSIVTGIRLNSVNDTQNEDDYKGSGEVLLYAGTKTATIETKITDAAEITNIDLGDNIDVVAGSEKDVIQPIEVKDQDGYTMKDFDVNKLTASVDTDEAPLSDSDVSVVEYYTDEEDEIHEVSSGEEVEGLALKVDAPDSDVDEAKNVKVKVAENLAQDSDKKAVEGTTTVKVNPTAKVDSVKATVDTENIAVKGSTTVKLETVDQYGDPIKVSTPSSDIKLKSDNVSLDEESIEAIHLDEDGKKIDTQEDQNDDNFAYYELTVNGVSKGTSTAKISVEYDSDEDPVTTEQSFTVGSVAELVDSVEIEDKDEVNNSGETGKSEVDLEATAKDKDGNKVDVTDKDFTWSVKSVKDAEGNELKVDSGGEVTDPNNSNNEIGTVTIDNNGKLKASKGITVEVEAQVKTSNLKTATTTVNFNSDASEYAEGLQLSQVGDEAEVDGKEVDNDTTITFDNDSIVDGDVEDIELTFEGVDQYGDEIDTEGGLDVELSTGDRSVATTDTLDVIAEGEGEGVIYAEAGDDQVELDVEVTQEVAEALEAEQALETIKGYATDDNASELTVDQLETAGVENANSGNLDAYKAAVAGEDSIADLDALQTLIDDTNTAEEALETIKGYATDDNASELTVDQLETAGVENVNSDNLDAYKEVVEEAESIDTLDDVESLVQNVNDIQGHFDSLNNANLNVSTDKNALSIAKSKLNEDEYDSIDITWTNNQSVIDTDGDVSSPDSENQDVNVSYRITKGGVTIIQNVNVRVTSQ